MRLYHLHKTTFPADRWRDEGARVRRRDASAVSIVAGIVRRGRF